MTSWSDLDAALYDVAGKIERAVTDLQRQRRRAAEQAQQRAEEARKRRAAKKQQRQALQRQREQEEAQKQAAAEARQVAEQQQREAQQRRELDEARRTLQQLIAQRARSAREPKVFYSHHDERHEQPREQPRPEATAAARFADFAVFRDVDAPWCPEMVPLQAGEFLMGSPESDNEGNADERPQHRLAIGYRFVLGRYPVTFAEYDHFCATSSARFRPWAQREKPADHGWGRGRRPVINVSWRDARAYVEWLAKTTGKPYRLPSEAEWEYAARAGTTTRYAFGSAITPKDANYSESKLGKTTEVGAYPPNAWGLHDMQGNVWEWVEDVWHDGYKGAPTESTAWVDSEGKHSSSDRVYRGGSWSSFPSNLRSAGRLRGGPDYRDLDLGFRVARTLD